ncbi:MAG TPA: site-specific integrase [Armatimonadota bacterium]|nr:site-specific integrase [Armatimonadota bacterium]
MDATSTISQFMEVTCSPVPVAPDPVALPAIDTPSLSLQPVIDQARHFFQQTTAANTLTSYQSDWRAFEAWCGEHGLQELPATPEVVACYLTACAMRGLKVATIRRHLGRLSMRSTTNTAASHPPGAPPCAA